MRRLWILLSFSFLGIGAASERAFAQGMAQWWRFGIIPSGAGDGFMAQLQANCNFLTGRMTAACIPLFIGHLVRFIISLIGLFFLLNIMYAGYQIAFGSLTGNRDKGKTRLTWSIIGFVVTVCAFVILDLLYTLIVFNPWSS